MTGVPEYGPPVSDQEVAEAVEITSRAFARVSWAGPDTFERAGRENHRVLREKGTVVASLLLVPMGQWFGGRSVPMVGIGSVAVAAERWGQGLGRRLMCETVRELHEAETALSALHPATFRLYRAAGYEPAGSKSKVTIAASRIGLSERTLPLRPIEPSDEAAIFQLHREHASRFPGHCDRSPFICDQVRQWEGKRGDGSLVEVDGRVEGYLYSAQQLRPDSWVDLHVLDVAALTARAGRRLLTFLHDHRSQVETIDWQGESADPLLALLPEPVYQVRSPGPWMLRIVHVPAALGARGYPEGIGVELHLRIRDPVLPANDGPFLLEVSNGQGRVKQGGEGRVQLDVRGLAPLYTGYLSPQVLKAAGLLDGPEADLRSAAAAFAGPVPWMREGF
jgi:predicted acetyltransferase